MTQITNQHIQTSTAPWNIYVQLYNNNLTFRRYFNTLIGTGIHIQDFFTRWNINFDVKEKLRLSGELENAKKEKPWKTFAQNFSRLKTALQAEYALHKLSSGKCIACFNLFAPVSIDSKLARTTRSLFYQDSRANAVNKENIINHPYVNSTISVDPRDIEYLYIWGTYQKKIEDVAVIKNI
jgi:hypothetical protein